MKIDFFEPILLDQMDQVKLMNRTDTKYWFHTGKLQGILQELRDSYYILQIGGDGLLPYTTTYFDTVDNQMFAAHHNRKLNRFKIRRRTYLSSNKSYMEIKFKSNKGRTIKSRIGSVIENKLFSDKDTSFLNENSPFNTTQLQPVLVNQFNRMMLVSKNLNERCTIDLDLNFKTDIEDVSLENLVIVEVKAEGHAKSSAIKQVLQRHRIKTAGFSKYCVGRVVTDDTLKRNRFKGKIREIEKSISVEDTLY